jgi:hypothetical protein
MIVPICDALNRKRKGRTEPGEQLACLRAKKDGTRDNRSYPTFEATIMLDRIALQVVEVVFALAIYFLPAIIADHRKRHDVLTLALFNACMGWTVVGWLLALYWAHVPNPPASLAREVTAKRKLTRMTAFSTALMARIDRRAAKQDGVRR